MPDQEGCVYMLRRRLLLVFCILTSYFNDAQVLAPFFLVSSLLDCNCTHCRCVICTDHADMCKMGTPTCI
jgi:hypothetical protein